MSSSHEQPERQPARERPADEPVVTTTSAERYVMSGGRTSRLAVKEDDLFLYTNELGQVPGTENSVLGLYYRDTRYLSRYELSIAGRQPVLLSASAERGYAATVELTNLEARTADGHVLPQASVHVRRTRFVSDRLYELLRVRNYHQREVDLVLDLDFDADFADLFEVRGSRRRRRGSRLAPRVSDGALTLSYLGLDDVTRQTIVRFHDRPESLKQGRARFRLRLPPGERAVIRYDVQVVGPEAPGEAGGEFNARIGALRHEHERWESGATDIFTDNDQLNRALRRGQDDLRLLSTVIDGERVPLSGLPWFGAPFGREMTFVGSRRCCSTCAGRARRSRSSRAARACWTAPSARSSRARSCTSCGAASWPPSAPCRTRPTTAPWTPRRCGCCWSPSSRCGPATWTGSSSAPRPSTPRSAGSTARATPTATGSWSTSAAPGWGCATRGGATRSTRCCTRTARRPRVPIALAETQGYVYYAKRRLAAVFGQLGDVERAERLSQDAARLKRAFNERFWIEDQGFYAMALDGQKRQVRSASSTIGHALWSRIVAEEHVPAVVRRLMAPDMFTGWGIRTLSKEARFYNPVSFYNGSVWPFDTALIANGLKKHGYVQEANRLAWGLVEAAAAHEYARLPEMFCGFTRQTVDRPVSFPMACSPDANSAAALFLVLQSMLGIYAQAEENIVYVHAPVLPRWLGEVTLSNLRVGRTTMRLRFRREGGQTSFSVLDKQGPGRIVVVE